MIEIETNPNFSKNDVENPPFLIDTCRRIRGNPPASNLRNPHNPNLIPQNVSAPQYIQGHANLSNPQAMNTGPPNFAPPYARIPSSQAPKPALNQGPPKYPLPSGGPNLPSPSNQGSQNLGLPFANTKPVLPNPQFPNSSSLSPPQNLPPPSAGGLNLSNPNFPIPNTGGFQNPPNLENTGHPNLPSGVSNMGQLPNLGGPQPFPNSANLSNSKQGDQGLPSFNTGSSKNQNNPNVPKLNI